MLNLQGLLHRPSGTPRNDILTTLIQQRLRQLSHKKIRLPILIHAACELPKERHMIRANGTARQNHLRLIRSLAALYIIASNASAHQIFPRILAAPAFRHDMIDRQGNARCAAILAPVTIPPKDIFPRKNYLLKWHSNIRRKTNDAWKRHRNGSGAYCLARHAADEFCFFKIKQNNCFFDIRDR